MPLINPLAFSIKQFSPATPVAIIRSGPDFLLIVRGIAALSVVLWHAGGYLGPYPWWMNVPGRTAVWIFFGISGYVIAYGFVHQRYSLTSTDLKDFYINRFLRIYPIFLVLTFLGWVTETLRLGSSPLSISDIPAQLFAIQFNQDYLLNGVFWTLGIELHFYLLAPLLVIPMLQKKRWVYMWTPAGLYSATIFWYIYAYKMLGWSFDGRNILTCLPHFLAGMIACRLTVPLSKNKLRFRLSLTSALALIVITNGMYHLAPHIFWSPLGILLVDIAVIFLVVAHRSWDKSMTDSTAAITWLGVLSYGLYAWHGYWIKTLTELEQHVLTLALLSLFTAYLSYRLVEAPAQKMKRSHTARNEELSIVTTRTPEK